MKTLYIIRHAKSAFKGAGMEDFIRPLAERGEKNAKELGKILKRKEIIPDHIISSPAVRALQTCYAVCAKMKYGKEIQYERGVYDHHSDSDISYYIELISKIDSENQSAFIFGHNNAWNLLANYYLGEDIGNIPSGGLVCIQFDVDTWKEIDAGNGKLQYTWYPEK